MNRRNKPSLDISNDYKIAEKLLQKSYLQQNIYEKLTKLFNLMNQELEDQTQWILKNVDKSTIKKDVYFKRSGEFETEVKFASDTLVFIKHSNIFKIPDDHYIMKTNYIKEDKNRAYCGVILVYNFLSDSIKYKRMEDKGLLLARIFVNKDGFYFLDGPKQSYKNLNFSKEQMNINSVRVIIQEVINHAIESDLYISNPNKIRTITLESKIMAIHSLQQGIGKKVGYILS